MNINYLQNSYLNKRNKNGRESFPSLFRHGPIENENIVLVYTAIQMLSADMVSMSK